MPPYRADDETKLVPASASAAAVRNSAAWPDAVATAPMPPSRLAIRSSKAAVVGLEIRE